MKNNKQLNPATAILGHGADRIKGMVSDMEKKLKQGEEQVKHLVSNVDKKVHENPWPVVAGIAAGCLFMGFMMGITKRR